jgi:proteasome lid subunit RPN8/RPN11
MPILRFTPYAWAKLLHLRDAGPTEIGGFGITTENDLLLIEDVATVAQTTTAVTVAFNDAAVADFFESQVDQVRRPEQFARIWIHTHPGDSPMPSSTDEETFARVFGNCDWAIMFILAKGGKTYCRLRFNIGPGGEAVLATEIDFAESFPGSDIAAWKAEYDLNVHAEPLTLSPSRMHSFCGDSFRRPHRDDRIEERTLEEDVEAHLEALYAEQLGMEGEVPE